MPALALTDLANVFGLVKFYKAARARGVKPIVGCDVWLTHDAERDQPFRALLLAQSRAGYLKLADWLSRAYRDNQHRGRAELRREWFGEGTDGLIALSGARDGDVGQALLQGNAAGAAKAARDWAALFPGPLLPRGAARRTRRRRCARRGDGARSRPSSRCRSSRRIRCSSCAATISARTRRASASPKATCSPTRGGRGRFTPEQYFKIAGARWRRCSPTCPRRSRTRSRSRSAAT